jgi:hypothetical protein
MASEEADLMQVGLLCLGYEVAHPHVFGTFPEEAQIQKAHFRRGEQFAEAASGKFEGP